MKPGSPEFLIRSISTLYSGGSVGGMTDWNDKAFLKLIKMAATPVDYDNLIANGVLRRHGRRYELLDLARLPEHARRKIRIVTTSRKTTRPVVSFLEPSRQMVRQAIKMGLLPPD